MDGGCPQDEGARDTKGRTSIHAGQKQKSRSPAPQDYAAQTTIRGLLETEGSNIQCRN